MNPATGALILDGWTALTNLMIRLIEARELAAERMARTEAEAEEVAEAGKALAAAIDRARSLLEAK